MTIERETMTVVMSKYRQFLRITETDNYSRESTTLRSGRCVDRAIKVAELRLRLTLYPRESLLLVIGRSSFPLAPQSTILTAVLPARHCGPHTV